MVVDGRQPAREGATISAHGDVVGAVTSGNFSPMLETAIALGFVSPTFAIGDAVTFDVRGRTLEGYLADLPFVEKKL